MTDSFKATLRSSGVAFFFIAASGFMACSVIATRPVQEMSDAASAMKAAREVQADNNAPEYFRLSEELFFKARQEYRLKNFSRARKLAIQARESAEKAEFLSIRGGAVRSSLVTIPTEAPPAHTPAQPSGPPNGTPDGVAAPTPPSPPTAPTP